jgi:hypothetical protein
MDGDTGAATPQAGDATQPQAGTAPGQAPDAAPATTDDPIARELAEARREAANYRTQVRRFEQEREAATRASMSEQERLQAERRDFDRDRAAFQAEQQDFRLRQSVSSLATQLGFIDPEDAYVHLDRAAIEYTDDGKPRGLERMLRDILTRKPHLLSPTRTATVTRGVQPAAASSGDWNAALRRAAGVQES